MGCDIHIFVEKRNGDKWEPVAGPNPWKEWHWEQYQKERAAGRDGKFHLQRYELKEEKCYENWIYEGRNYTLFSLLAGVRNGMKYNCEIDVLMGCDADPRFTCNYSHNTISTGHYITPISEPKGLPDNISSYIKNESEKWSCDGHSRSYYTLRELQMYVPNQNIKHSAFVDEKQYKKYKENGKPTAWTFSVYNNVVSNELMEDLIYTDKEVLLPVNFINDKSLTLIQWEEPINNTGFYGIVHKLEDLGIHPDDVRIVFWFDN